MQTAPNAALPVGTRKPSAEDIEAMLGDDKPKTLYVKRTLRNARDIVDWAIGAGFKKTLPVEDIHVTVAFSKTPIVWPAEDDEDVHVDAGGPRKVERLGDEGAVVLRFKSSQLAARWQQLRDAGASWDYESYKPHVTFTMMDEDDDLPEDIEPYDGPLEFGPEEFDEASTGKAWAVKAKASLAGDADDAEFNESDHPRDKGKFTSGSGSSGSKSEGESKPVPSSSGNAKEIDTSDPTKIAFQMSDIDPDEAHATVHALIDAGKKPTTQSIPVDKLRGTQDDLKSSFWNDDDDDEGEELGENPFPEYEDKPVILKVGDVYNVLDGHNRISAQIRSGKKQVEGYVFEQPAAAEAAKPPVAAKPETASGGNVKSGMEKLTQKIEMGIPAEWAQRALSDTEKQAIVKKYGGIGAAYKAAWETRYGKKMGDTALDSFPLLLALDRDSVRTMRRDGQLQVAKANISKACVNPYRGHEIPGWEGLGLDPNRIYQLYRDPKELAKGAATSNGVQLLRKHIPVSADDHQPWDTVGSLGTDAEFDGEYVTNSLFVNARDAIDGIESGEKRELSSGYHYKPDMTPGNFNGKAFDGVMRDIVFNHVALVEDGRAGPDVVVGDSNEEINMSNRDTAKMLNALAHRMTSVQALTTYLRPKLAKAHIAMDSKPLGIMAKIFDGVTGTNFKTQKPVIAKRIRDLTKGKLAQDASLDDVEKVLDMLDGHEVDAGDVSVSEPEHNAMEAAAHGQSTIGIPEKVGKEFVSKDNGEEGLRKFLGEKGMGQDDIDAACSMMKPKATDEDPESPEAKKKREEEEAAKKAGTTDKAAKDADPMADKDKDDKKDAKPAMDAKSVKDAIGAAVSAERERNRGLQAALQKVRPIVGEFAPEVAMAFDSADDVYRAVLKMRGVQNVDKLHREALEPIVDMQRPASAVERVQEQLGMDAAGGDDFNKLFPTASRIGAA